MGALLAGGLPGLLNQSSAQIVDGSLKFDKSVGNYQKRTHTAGNRKTYTWSGWIKRSSNLNTNEFFFGGGPDGNNNTEQITFFFMPSDAFRITTGSIVFRETTRLFRDPSSFYHLVVAFDTTLGEASARIKIYVNGSLVTSYTSQGDPGEDANTGINAAVEHVLGKGPGSDYSASTYNFDGSMSQVTFLDGLALGPGYFGFTDPLTGTWRPKKFRAEGTTVNDGTQWSSYITNSSGASNLFDGNLSTTYGPDGNPQTWTPPKPIEVASSVRIYYSSGVASRNFEINDNGNVVATGTGTKWVDLNFTGSLKKLSGTNGWNVRAIEIDGIILVDSTTTNLAFGTNGFYLPMDNDDFNIDKSGNGNNWTKQNFSGTSIDPDVLKDSPSGAVSGGRAQTGITTTSSAPSNYATLNPLDLHNTADTLSEGNLKLTSSGSGNGHFSRSTISMSSGKYFCEVKWIDVGQNFCGIQGSNDINYNNSYVYLSNAKASSTNGSSEGSGYGATWTTGDTIGIAYDADSKTLEFFKNGVSQGVAFTSITGTYDPNPTEYQFFFGNWSAQAATYVVNFGQKPFKYAPPQGHLPLNSASVTPETVITRPDQFVGTTIWTGDGSSNRLINVGLQPDLVWVKRRSTTSNHVLMDTIRGHSKGLYPNLVSLEQNDSSINAFNSNGFTVNGNGDTNQSSQTFVGWSWKAGGNKNTFNVDDVGYASVAAAGLDGGTLNPTAASVGTKQGFSIIKYTGAGAAKTINHGLNQAPEFMLVKRTDANASWAVYHVGTGNTKVFELNSTTQPNTSSSVWNSTTPTSSVFSIGDYADSGGNSNVYISYLWHSVPGLQKFGTYDGNSSNDGPFIELGFRPAVLLIKRYDGAGNWIIVDSKRNPFNVVDKQLLPNLTDGDYTEAAIDLVSNGFKVRLGSSGHVNIHDFVYAAWAEAPVSNLFGGQSNAR